MYQHCPSPMHSRKWYVVTSTTVAGGRDWSSLCGMTLCDRCYTFYRKHGTFIRPVRTLHGWASFDPSAEKNSWASFDPSASAQDVDDWVRTVLLFLDKNGRDILQAICARYNIPYDRSIASIPIGTWEQVAKP